MPVQYHRALLNSQAVAVAAAFSIESFFSGSRIDLPTNAIWTSLPGDWTVEAWVNIGGTQTGYQTIIGMGTSGDQFGFFHHRTGSGVLGNIRVYQSGAGGEIVQSTNAIVPIGVWAHVAVTRRSSDSTFCTYVNGAADLTNHAMTRAQVSACGTSRTLCGDGVSEVLQGDASDIRVWNVARTAAQISANYNRRLAAQSGLIGYWRLDDGPLFGTTGTTAADSSGVGGNGTLNDPTLGSHIRFIAGGPSFF